MSHIQINNTIPRIRYVSNGTLLTYDFSFAIFKATDLKVYFNSTLQNASTYTVTGVGSTNGGSITLNQAPTSGTIITLSRELSFERTTDFQEGGALRADSLNSELDYQIACQQQLADNLNRSMVLPPYAVDTDVNLTLPIPSAGKAIVWNAQGTNLENSTVSVNALESTLNGYKTTAQTASATATAQAQIATNSATTATQKATEASQSASQALSASTNKANITFDNVDSTNAHKLIGNRIWISDDYDISGSANVMITHNLGLTDITKAIAIPYLRIVTPSANYATGDIVSNFTMAGTYSAPSGIAYYCGYLGTLNLTENTVMIPKTVDSNALFLADKNTGYIIRFSNSIAKVFVKIIY